MDELVKQLLSVSRYKVRGLQRNGFNSRTRVRYYNSQPPSHRWILLPLPQPVAKELLHHLEKWKKWGTTSETSCKCSFFAQWRLPCYHVLHYRKSMEVDRWMKPFNRSVTHLCGATHIPSTKKRQYPRNTIDPAQKLSRLQPYINLIEESVVKGGEEVSEFWLRSAMWFAKASKREG